MRDGIYLAFDVGGTSIKAGAIDSSGRVLEHTLSHYESKANESAAEIVDHFVHMAADLLQQADPEGLKKVAGIGYAFPGPFDYEQGISYIKGLNKFEALYGLRVGERLSEKLRADRLIGSRLDREPLLRFENDAALFTLGEAHYGQAAKYNRAVCLTIGTGIGSGFVEAGQLIAHRVDVPDNGWVYKLPYRSGIADDYISRRGLLELAGELGITLQGRDVKELAESACRGDKAAILLFDTFGRRMAEALETALKPFAPDIIVLGGQISKSGQLFAPSFRHELVQRGIKAAAALSEHSLQSTLLGIYYMLTDNNK